jgi:hypothetical protein
MLKDYLPREIQGLIENRSYLKSPLGKGGFRGISSAYKIPLTPPFSKGGIKTSSIQAHKLFYLILIGLKKSSCGSHPGVPLALSG